MAFGKDVLNQNWLSASFGTCVPGLSLFMRFYLCSLAASMPRAKGLPEKGLRPLQTV